MNRLFKAIQIAISLFYSVPDASEVPKEILESKKRRRRLVLFGIISLLIVISSAQLLFTGTRVRIPIANNLLVLFLLNINIILLLVMAVLVGRNLIKLYFERHGHALGARFQTKLVVSFMTLTLIPSILLFIVASGLITNSIDNWFSDTVEDSLKNSLEVAEKLYQRAEQGVSEKAATIAGMIDSELVRVKEKRHLLDTILWGKLHEYGTDAIAVLGPGFDTIAVANMAKLDTELPGPISENHLKLLQEGEVVTETQIFEQKAQIVSLAPIKNQFGELLGILLVIDSVDKSIVEKINTITGTFDEYKQLKLQKFPIKAVYEVTLFLLTLIILFAAIWYGFYLARDITVPIQKLAEATHKVTDGDLTVRLEEKSNDEIGFLIKSFNRMTEELETSQHKVDSSHKELVEINMELDRRRKYIETIMAKIDTGVISIDSRGRITTCNPSAITILKLKSNVMEGKHYEEAFEAEHLKTIKNLLREMGKNEKDSMEQELQLMIDGVQVTLLVHVSALRDAARRFLGLAVVFDDLTTVINAKKTSAWREIAQYMAHEIKNPLTPIRLNAERMARKYKQDPKNFKKISEESTRIIVQEVEVLQKLVDEFSRFAQLPVANPEMVSLHRVIGDVVTLYKDLYPHVTLKTQFDPVIGLVRIDKEQMHRAFRNLIENAIDAVDAKGVVEVHTALDQQAHRINIDIIDDGPGIDVKDHDKVFLPYFSAKKKGTGLGLAIVNRIVADHEGHIRVKNRSPRGTVMAIDIPAA